jgi:hypothetical protein
MMRPFFSYRRVQRSSHFCSTKPEGLPIPVAVNRVMQEAQKVVETAGQDP